MAGPRAPAPLAARSARARSDPPARAPGAAGGAPAAGSAGSHRGPELALGKLQAAVPSRNRQAAAPPAGSGRLGQAPHPSAGPGPAAGSREALRLLPHVTASPGSWQVPTGAEAGRCAPASARFRGAARGRSQAVERGRQGFRQLEDPAALSGSIAGRVCRCARAQTCPCRHRPARRAQRLPTPGKLGPSQSRPGPAPSLSRRCQPARGAGFFRQNWGSRWRPPRAAPSGSPSTVHRLPGRFWEPPSPLLRPPVSMMPSPLGRSRPLLLRRGGALPPRRTRRSSLRRRLRAPAAQTTLWRNASVSRTFQETTVCSGLPELESSGQSRLGLSP